MRPLRSALLMLKVNAFVLGPPPVATVAAQSSTPGIAWDRLAATSERYRLYLEAGNARQEIGAATLEITRRHADTTLIVLGTVAGPTRTTDSVWIQLSTGHMRQRSQSPFGALSLQFTGAQITEDE